MCYLFIYMEISSRYMLPCFLLKHVVGFFKLNEKVHFFRFDIFINWKFYVVTDTKNILENL